MKEITVDENTAYFLIRNIIAHEPMHDFNPSGCISRIKKLNKRFMNCPDEECEHSVNLLTYLNTPD